MGTRLAIAAVLVLTACASTPPVDPTTVAYAPDLGIDFAAMERTESGVWYQDLSEGVGETVDRGDRVRIHYVAYLTDGTIVDSSIGGSPFAFRLGDREVIRGWTDGMVGMRLGGQRRLVVPPDRAYGGRGQGDVPPDAVLIFDIQLLAGS